MTKKYTFKHLLLLSLSILFFQCDKEVTTDPDGDISTQILNAVLLTDQPTDSEPVLTIQDSLDVEITQTDVGELTCHNTAYTAKQVRDLVNMVASDGIAGIIYPGAVIQGGNFKSGQFTPVTIPKAGGTLTLTGLSGGKTRSIDVAAFDADQVENKTAELLSLISEENEGTVADFGFFVEETNSVEEFRFHMGLDARYKLVSVESRLNLNQRTQQSVVTMQFTQRFFSMYINDPVTMFDLFEDGDQARDPEDQISPSNPPLYVKRVDYGRQIFFRAESNADTRDVKAILNAAVQGKTLGEVKLNSGLSASKVWEQTKVTYVVKGGSSDIALREAPTYESILQVIQEGASWSPANPGAPIAYELRYLANRAPARIAFTSDFVRRSCTIALPNVTRYKIKLDRVQCYDCEPFGEIEDGAAEIRGNVYIRTTRDANEQAYSLSLNGVNIAGTKSYPDRSHTFSFEELRASDKIYVRGNLYEDDVTNDDDFGTLKRTIDINVFGNSGEFSLDFKRGSGLSAQRARVWFVVTKL